MGSRGRGSALFTHGVVHHLVGAELAAHGAGAVVGDTRLGPEAPRPFRVDGEVELPLPVEFFAAAGHGPVPLHGPLHPLGDVGGVGGDARGDDPFPHVLDGGEPQVLRRGDVAVKISYKRIKPI